VVKKFGPFIVVASLVFTLKLLLASVGYNNDMLIWKDVSEGMREGFLSGRSVYTYTQFYNHGPIRSYALFILASVLNKLSLHDMTSFHLAVVFFLSISDTVISLLLWRMFGKIPAFIYLLNPVTTLITGYHSQIEATVIMLGLISWAFFLKAKTLYLNNDTKYKKMLLVSALILGFSMGIKHVLFFFPVFILLAHRKHKLFSTKEILAYTLIPYTIFFGLFGVEILRDSYNSAAVTYRSIRLNVFEYRAGGLYGNSTFATLVKLFIPEYYVDTYFSKIPLIGGYTFFFVATLLSYGALVIAKLKDLKLLFPLYLLAMFAFSPSIADQYLAVPLVAMAVFYENIISFIYFAFSYFYLTTGASANISNLSRYPMVVSIFGFTSPLFPFNFSFFISVAHIQAWSILLAVSLLSQISGFSLVPAFKRVVKGFLW